MVPVSLWLQHLCPPRIATRQTPCTCPAVQSLPHRGLKPSRAAGSEAEPDDDFPFDDTSIRLMQQRIAGRPDPGGVQLVKGTGTATLAPGNLTAVREPLSMPAPAEFEEHDPWALRAMMEKRKQKRAEDRVWRARKAQKHLLRHLNVDWFTDKRCRDYDEDPARHYSHDEIMNIITGDWKNANPFTVQHQCNNPTSVSDWAGQGIEMPPDTDEWIQESGLTAFGDILAPKVAPSQDMLDSEFQGLEGSAGAEEGQDTSLSEDFSDFDMDDAGGD